MMKQTVNMKINPDAQTVFTINYHEGSISGELGCLYEINASGITDKTIICNLCRYISPMQVTKAPLPICYICKPHLFNITSIFLKKTQNAKIATKFDQCKN